MDTIVARLREPSTYAGLAAITIAAGHTFPGNGEIVNVAVTLFGVLAAVLSEKGGFNTQVFLHDLSRSLGVSPANASPPKSPTTGA